MRVRATSRRDSPLRIRFAALARRAAVFGFLTLRSRRAAMSSDEVVSRFQELMNKASELTNKGHVLSAAEKYACAAEVTRALGPDNLLALGAQLRQVNMLFTYVTSAAGARNSAETRTLAAHRSECVALLCGAVEVLARRCVAGTLLDGKCSHEEVVSYRLAIQHSHSDFTFEFANSFAQLVGYAVYLQAADIMLDVRLWHRAFEAECSKAQLHAFAQQAVLAAEWIQQPRRHGNVPFAPEGSFVKTLRATIVHAGAHGLDARVVQLLADASKRLECSGVLQIRHIEEAFHQITSMRVVSAAAVTKSLSATDRRSCSLAGCGAKEAHPQHFKRCAACRAAAYCCREHQVAHWPAHKAACKAARKVDGGT